MGEKGESSDGRGGELSDGGCRIINITDDVHTMTLCSNDCEITSSCLLPMS
jgi:hypothetical protein